MENITNLIMELFIIFIGALFAVYHKSLGTKAIKERKKVLEALHIKMQLTDIHIKQTQIMFLLLGIIFVIVGILALLRIVNVKP